MAQALIPAPADPTGQAPAPAKAPDMPAPPAVPQPKPEGLDYSAAPDIQQYTGEETAKSGETADLQHTTTIDKFKSVFGFAAHDEGVSAAGAFDNKNGYGTWARQLNEAYLSHEYDQQGATKLTSEQAAQKYPGIPVGPGGEYDGILKSRYDDKQYTDFLQRQIAMGPDTSSMFGGPIPSAFELATGLAAGATNPINYIMGAVSKAAGLAGKGIAGVAKIYAANVAMGLPALGTVPQLRAEGRTEITYAGMAPGIATGAVIGTALHLGLEHLSETAVKAKVKSDAAAALEKLKSEGLPTETREKAAVQAFAQNEKGQKIDVRAALDEAEVRMSGATKSGTPDPYDFVPMLTPDHDGRTMYAVTDPKDGSAGTFGHNVAEGAVHLTDREQAAANIGDRHAVEIDPSTRTVNLDTLLTEENEDGKALAKAVGDVVGDKLDVSNSVTYKDLLEDIKSYQEAGHLPPDTVTKIQEKLAEAGVDGYRWMHMKDGEAAHNMMALFDENKGKSTGYTPYDPSIVPTRDMGDVAADLENPDKSTASSPEIDDKIREAKAEESKSNTDDMQKLKQGEAQSVAAIKRVQEGLKPTAKEGTSVVSPEQERLNKLIDDTMKGIDDQHTEDLKDIKDKKALSDCVMGSS